MKKYTQAEKQYLKGIIGTLALEKHDDVQIQTFLKEKGIDINRSTIGKHRRSVAKSAEKWYNELRKSKFLYIAHFKERIDTTYKVENKLWSIANDSQTERSEVIKACAEITKNEMFLSNLYDIARYLTERIEKDGSSPNNESLSTERETEGVRTTLPNPIPDIE
jgi:hypothetical protein